MKRYFVLSVVTLLAIGGGCASKTVVESDDADTTDIDSSDIYFDDDAVDVVTADVYGKDLALVERYPASVRSYYSSNEYETDVTYQTSDSMEDVRSYYHTALTAAGWENSEEATDYMEYIKGDDANPEIMTVYFTSYASQGIVEYELVHEPALTDGQLQELENEDADF